MEDLQSILLPGIDSKRPIIIAGPRGLYPQEIYYGLKQDP